MSLTVTPFYVPLQLSKEAHYYAKKFADEQATVEKAKQVYLNTLAVCAVYSYLHWMEFKADISQGESWNYASQRFNDVADLVIPGIGRLECRRVLPGETEIALPLDVTEDRIGCVLVQFEEELDKVKLLGFIPADVSGNLSEVIKIAVLQSLEELIERLEDSDTVVVPSKTLVNLSQWLQDNFIESIDAGWQTIEEIFSTRKASLAVRYAAVQRGKLIDLEVGKSVALIVALMSEDEEEIIILLQLRPTDSQTLPVGLKLTVLDTSGETISESQAIEESEFIQVQLSDRPENSFSVRVALDEVSVTENFTI